VNRPLILRLSALVLSAALSCASACAPPARAQALPAPIELSTLGPGVLFELRVMREEDGFSIGFGYVVAPDGTVDLPYVGRMHVAGLEPQEVAEAVRSELIKRGIKRGILSEPIVSVSVKEYTPKRIEVLGEVMRPGSLPMRPGLTLVRAISLVGGFSAMADKTRIVIRRRGVKATISIEGVLDGRIPDPLLQFGDSIQVDQR
jgi:protein involved in polysaccharide export with SLBB domain